MVFESVPHISVSPQVTRGELARWRDQYVDDELLEPTRRPLFFGAQSLVAEQLLARMLTELDAGDTLDAEIVRQLAETAVPVGYEG